VKCMTNVPYVRKKCWLFALSIAALYGQTVKTGPDVGQQVPDFSAEDQEGRQQTLKSIMGVKGTMLVFFRSADW
jgi:hypothetical protein